MQRWLARGRTYLLNLREYKADIEDIRGVTHIDDVETIERGGAHARQMARFTALFLMKLLKRDESDIQYANDGYSLNSRRYNS